MPHIVVKLWPGKSKRQKQQLADAITKNVMSILKSAEESVSVGFDEVDPVDWTKEVYTPDIQDKWDTIYKKPGYGPI